MRSCAFTGHRDIDESLLPALRGLLMRGVRYMYSLGVRDFYAGGARGFDTEAAEAVLCLKEEVSDVSLHLILPHKGQDARFSDSDKRRYAEVLKRADSHVFLAEHYFRGVMRYRNQSLVEHADAVIAYLVSGGGTAQTVAMAEKKGIAVYNLADELR